MNLDDVVRLKETPEGRYYALINDHQLFFDPSEGVIKFKHDYVKAHPSVFSIELLSRQGIPFHDTTPLKFVLEDSFSLVLNNTDHFMILKFGEEDIFDNEAQRTRDAPTRVLLKGLGSSEAKRAILSHFVHQIIDEILKNKSSTGKINGHTLLKITEGKIMRDCIEIQTHIDKINQMLKVLKEKKNSIEVIKKLAAEKVSSRAKRRLKMLYTVVACQMLFTQWGTFSKYSWDVMEPICCLFGIFDSILAYTFWLLKNDDYSLENFEKKFIEQGVDKYLSKNFNVREQEEDIDAMINHLELWKSLHSASLPEILEALDSKFKPIE